MKTADLVQLKAWSERVCRLDATDPMLVVAALGVGTSPAAYIGGIGRVERPPIGTSHAEVAVVQGRFRSLSLTFATPSITLATLQDALGPGLVLRRTRPLAPYRVAHRVVVAGAPYSCDVVAWCAEPPRPDTLVTRVTLRRHRGVTRAA